MLVLPLFLHWFFSEETTLLMIFPPDFTHTKTFFLLILRFCHLLYVCQLALCTHGFWCFRPPALLLSKPEFSHVWCLSTHLVFIQTSTRGSLPPHINIVCWMGICGWSCVETLEYLLFKGLVPYAVLVKVVVGGMQSWHSVTNRESFKIQQSTSPPLFVPVWEGTGKITQG